MKLLLLAAAVLGTAAPAPRDRGEGAPPLSVVETRRNARLDAFLLDAMRAGGLDAWIVLTREGAPDPLSTDLGFRIGRAALVFIDRGGRLERLAVVSSLDLVPLRQAGIYDRLVGVERKESFEDKLKEALASLDVKRIGVNMSPASGLADGLSATGLEMLKRVLGPGRASRLVPAEKAILSFRSKKLPEEVEIYRRGSRQTAAILAEAFNDGFLCPGRTTQTEMRDHVQQIAARHGFPETAWEREMCPGVYSGLFKDLSHAAPGEVVIQPGDIVWLDFGIRIEGYATDVIRAAYVLKPGETKAPAEVQKMFDTLRAANEAAVKAMKPGVFGWQVDAVARQVITDAGYPEHFHATGHPVGFQVHDAGPALAAKGRGPASELPLEVNQVFAVEPSVRLPRPAEGGSWLINMEEEVLVTPQGGEYLAPHQTELILIPAACRQP